MKHSIPRSVLTRYAQHLIWIVFFSFVGFASAQDLLCSSVRLRFEQELTFERQGFRGTLTVSNVGAATMEDLELVLSAETRSGSPVWVGSDSGREGSGFFVPEAELPSGRLLRNERRTFEMTLIPSAGLGGNEEFGVGYRIGGRLSYRSNGQRQVVSLSEAEITVFPQPELTLDIFLPGQVLGDDPDTINVVERGEAFPFGMMVRNRGAGTLRDLNLSIGQPRILENITGLLFAIEITGMSVDGVATRPTFSTVMRRIGRRGTASSQAWVRYQARSSLSGQFASMSTRVIHDDASGGILTSLIPQSGIRDHELIREVSVPRAGGDGLLDILARQRLVGDARGPLALHPTDGDELPVRDWSGDSRVVVGGQPERIVVTLPIDNSPAYLRMPDPHAGQKVITGGIQPDGQPVPAANAWKSKIWNRDEQRWGYFVHLFDWRSNTGGEYTLVFGNLPSQNRPPVIGQIPDQPGAAGVPFTQVITVSDESTTPVLRALQLPLNASLREIERGPTILRSLFSWTPAASQVGRHEVVLEASDGSLASTSNFDVVVGQDLFQGFKERYYGASPVADNADTDGDGMDTITEYALRRDPTLYDVTGSPVMSIERFGAEEYLTIQFSMRDDDPLLSETVVCFNSLATNAPTALATPVVIPGSGTANGLTPKKFRDVQPFYESAGPRFLRLRFSRSSP